MSMLMQSRMKDPDITFHEIDLENSKRRNGHAIKDIAQQMPYKFNPLREEMVKVKEKLILYSSCSSHSSIYCI